MRPQIIAAISGGAFSFAPHNVVERVVDTPVGLPSQWRARADLLQQFGDPNSARLWLIAVVELERALEAFDDETLTLVEAAKVSGYSPEHLGTLVKQGKIPNAGRPGAPRIRRADLPIKSATRPGRPSHGAQLGGRTDLSKLRRRR